MTRGAEINATNIGAVSEALIPLDPQGGVTVIRGYNGSGKDTLLEAVGRLTGGSQSVQCRDGEARGTVDGLGVHLTVTRSTRRSGECDAVSLAGKFDLSEFVDPPIKDPEASDARRIKALLSIRGVKGSPQAFAGIHEDVEMLVSADALNEPDIVEQARKIKASLEQHARKLESDRDKEKGRAEAAWGAAGDVTEEDAAGYDQDAAGAELEAAVAEKSRLTTQRNSFQEAQERAQKARATLDGLKAGPSIAECEAAEKAACAECDKAVEAFQAAKAALEKARNAVEAAETATATAKREAATTQAAHDAIVAAEKADNPTDAAISAATERADKVRARVQRGQVILEARRHFAAAREHEAEARRLDDQAEAIRDAAKQTDDVLSGLVSSGRIRVEAGRLVVDHKRRGKPVPFAELSKGEKWRLALLEAADRLREIGADQIALIPIPQQAWEGLQPKVRGEIQAKARRLNVCIVAAQCDDGPLRAELFDTGEHAEDVDEWQ
jgi:hypothetical protein